jgi:cation diffusion facilitator family transporter
LLEHGLSYPRLDGRRVRAIAATLRKTSSFMERQTARAQAARRKSAIRASVASIVINTVLFAAKLWVGMTIGSVAIVADAWHTLSDSLSSVFIAVASKLGARRADKEHPFGHGRWEPISALAVAFLLAFVSYEFFTDSLSRLREHESVTYGMAAIIVTIASIAIKEALAQYAFAVARRTKNAAVRADGWHHRSDALSSVVVLAGILIGSNYWWIDGALGIAVAAMLGFAACMVARDAITMLLGEEASGELRADVLKIVEEACPGGGEAHHIHIHNYITSGELTFHIRINGNITLLEAHDTATEIERRIRETLGLTATVHVEPLGVTHAGD